MHVFFCTPGDFSRFLSPRSRCIVASKQPRCRCATNNPKPRQTIIFSKFWNPPCPKVPRPQIQISNPRFTYWVNNVSITELQLKREKKQANEGRRNAPGPPPRCTCPAIPTSSYSTFPRRYGVLGVYIVTHSPRERTHGYRILYTVMWCFFFVK